MKTPDNIIDMAYDYLIIIFFGIPSLLVFNTLAGVIRSLGDSRTPLLIMIISSILNIALSLLFVRLLQLGVAGAAMATFISQTASVIGCLIVIKKTFHIIHLSKPDLNPDITFIKELLNLGIPMGLTFSILGVGSVFVQTAINSMGSLYVAAVTAAVRFDGLLTSVTAAIGNAMATYCGQNLGAGKIDRIRKGVLISSIIGIIYSVTVFVFIYFFGRHLLLLVVDVESTQLLDLAYRYLLICSGCYWLLSTVHILRTSLQGLGYGKIVFFTGFLETVGRSLIGLVFIPLYGFIAACFASPLAWILSVAFTVPAILFVLKRSASNVRTNDHV